MQEDIRASAPEDFPEVERFVALHEEGELRDPADVARELWDLVVSDRFENGAVMDLRGS
jgi:benzil reductase ((S)-benzoin forming)